MPRVGLSFERYSLIMPYLQHIHYAVASLGLPPVLVVGILLITGFYSGKASKLCRLPSIIGFMVAGVVLGGSLIGLLTENLQNDLGFITETALGFVALSIGLELDLRTIRRLGTGIIWAIFAESFGAFFVVLGGMYLLTRDLPMSLLFAAVAPASAPAGTVAVIQEYRAKGNLTKALYAVVGFDDGLGIIIFGFAAALAKVYLAREGGGTEAQGLVQALLPPLREVFLSVGVAGLAALALCPLLRRDSDRRSTFILTVAGVLVVVGVSTRLHLSLILTTMILGMLIVNTQPRAVVDRISAPLGDVMPLLFVLFFALAGAHLDLSMLPSLGLIGAVYILTRTVGLMAGAWAGSTVGRLEPKICRYLGMGILSQAGVAIGLALVVQKEFGGLGAHGKLISTQILTTVTATCIFYELIGPVLTRIALTRAGEINQVPE